MSVKRTPADSSLSSLSGGSSSGDLGSAQINDLGEMLETVGGFLQKIANFSLS